jgi:plasmid maintenance system antidote protein VapI
MQPSATATNRQTAPGWSAEKTTFRAYLQTELARRCSANPKYSLRAFALHLDIDHSTLSKLLRGRRQFTTGMIQRLGGRLKLSDSQIEQFSRREASRTPSQSTSEVRRLLRDAASLVTSLRHFAILELVRLDGFRADSRWIARVLGLSIDEVNIAVTRLIHLDLLEMTSRERWTDRSGETCESVDDFAYAAIQRLSERVKQLGNNEG